MNLRTGLKTGLAALTIATAPLNASAQKAARAVAADSVKIENTVVKQGNKWVSTVRKTNKNTGALICEAKLTSTVKPAGYKVPGAPKDKEGVFRVGVDYSSRDILGVRTSEPRLKAQFDGRAGKAYFRPEVAVGPESYHAVVPLGAQFNTGKGTSVEVGADLAGVRGFLNGKKVFHEGDVQKVMSGEKCSATAASGEFFQNVHVGARYKNDVVNASVRGEGGRIAYIDNWSVKEAPGSNLDAIKASGHPIKPKQSSGYLGARANVEVTPFKENRNIAINAEGAISTNKGPEVSVGAAYKF